MFNILLHLWCVSHTSSACRSDIIFTCQVRFTSKMLNANVYEMESSCVNGGLGSSHAPSTVHWCTSMSADLSEGQRPICHHQDDGSGAQHQRRSACEWLSVARQNPYVEWKRMWQFLYEAFRVFLTWIHFNGDLNGKLIWSKASGREQGVIILRLENVNNSACLGADWIANAFN